MPLFCLEEIVIPTIEETEMLAANKIILEINNQFLP
jgi:hypothetical protein